MLHPNMINVQVSSAGSRDLTQDLPFNGSPRTLTSPKPLLPRAKSEYLAAVHYIYPDGESRADNVHYTITQEHLDKGLNPICVDETQYVRPAPTACMLPA
jgi:hypothetical protein